MKTTMAVFAILLGASSMLGCQYYARSPEDYHKVTRKLIESKNDEIKSCYEKVRKSDEGAKGTVVVHFTLEPKTGKIVKPEVLPESTAPKGLGECVVSAIDGLVLDPPDQRLGDATFAYEFNEAG